jgi:hypothetical protein
VSSAKWTLDPEGKTSVLDPWLDQEPDPTIRETVLEWIGNLVRSPLGRGQEDEPGVFWAPVPHTEVEVLWILDLENLSVKLALVQ